MQPRCTKVKIDGKEKEQVEKQSYFTASTDGQYIYYNGLTDNHNIYEMDTSNDHAKVIYEGNCWMPVKDGNNLYFMDCENDYRIAKVDLTNGEKRWSRTAVSTATTLPEIRFSSRKMIRQIRPSAVSIQTEAIIRELKKGNYTAINVTSTYVYFKDFTTKTPYYTSVAAPGNVQIFNRKQALLQCNFLQKKKRQETSFFPGVSLSRKTNIYAKSNNDN